MRQGEQLAVNSISETALTQLGLDPSLYLNNGYTGRQAPSMDQLPERPSGEQNAAPGSKPDGRALPADDPQQREDSKTAPEVTPMTDEDPSDGEEQLPVKDKSEFTMPPEGRQAPDKDENGGSPAGQHPGGRDGGQFLTVPDSSRGNGQFLPGERPERPKDGASPRRDEAAPAPAGDVESSGEKG